MLWDYICPISSCVAVLLSSSLAAYYFLMMTPKPSIHWAQVPQMPQMLYP